MATARASVPRPAEDDIRPTLNLDSKRAARAKVKKKGPVITLAGKRYELPGSLSLEGARIMGAMSSGTVESLDEVLRFLFGDKRPRDKAGDVTGDDPRFAGFDLDDAQEIVEFVMEFYGMELGNSSASTPS